MEIGREFFGGLSNCEGRSWGGGKYGIVNSIRVLKIRFGFWVDKRCIFK